MKQGSDRSPESRDPSDASSPYERLGIPPDASFDLVQEARSSRLAEAGDDVMTRALIEAAYDAVLMDRLKERQQGRVSSSARTASLREQVSPPPGRPLLSPLPSLPQLPVPRLNRPSLPLPSLSLAEGRERWFPLVADGILLVFLLATPTATAELFQLLLALATGVTVLNLQRRNGRFLASVGWSFALLLIGLLLGALLVNVLFQTPAMGALPIGPLQLQSLPALLLLLLGALLIA